MGKKLWQYPGGKKGRWATLLIWIALLAILNFVFPQANSQKTETAGDLEKTAPSQLAKAIADKEFPADKGIPALLAWHRGSGLENVDLEAIQTVVKKLNDHPASYQESIPPFHQMPPEALRRLISKDGTTLIIPVSFQEKTGPEELEKGIGDIEKTIKSTFGENPLSVKAGTEDKLLVRLTYSTRRAPWVLTYSFS
ncbi:MMPL family transporter [Bacillus sp. FJAT-27445]|uniref:MMPL family transporter n=1 Tax=Bacillus sp. FJAT-27445 TaxID=1679166 RepID=UPI0007437A5D|nr:MMPL family transporter [Bacillus sp. FJAT-27445]